MAPASPIPVSIRTIPLPDAIAQALPWGTPGHGSGRRRRHTPGSTRSPRPSSRLRRAVAMRPVGGQSSRRKGSETVATTEQGTHAAEVARAYFEALGRGDRNAQREWYADD